MSNQIEIQLIQDIKSALEAIAAEIEKESK